MKSTKIAAGRYEVKMNKGNTWTLLKNNDLSGPAKWIAYNDDNSNDVTDPMFTKAEVLEVLTRIDEKG